MPISKVGEADNCQLQNVANILASSKRVVVVTGAGISTNCGIPDFRSVNGLYNQIQSQNEEASLSSDPTQSNWSHLDLSRIYKSASTGKPNLPPAQLKGKSLFSSSIWNDAESTSRFYKFMASLRQKIHEDVKQTSKVHRFIGTLRDSRKLVRCYTQNIDGLETREGLCADLDRGKGNRSRFTKKAMSLPKAPGNLLPGGILDGGCEVVQLHGDLNLLRCNICRQSTKWDEYGSNTLLLRGNAPVCESCKIQDQDRRNRGKRGTRVGSLRPNIVLYGEEHPSMDAIGSISTHDLALGPDVLLILGTSLHVHGLKVLIKEFAKCVHARTGSKGNVIFVNLTQPSESVWNVVIDYWVSMDCDKWIDAMRRHRPDMWQIQENLEIQVKKPLSKPAKKIGGSREVFGSIKVGTVVKKSLTSCSKSKLGHPTAVPTSRRPLHTIINGCSKSLTFSENNSNTKFSPSLKQKGECNQLQTPPPSGHRCRLQEISRKRPLDDLEVPTTPSKRSKNTLSIWQDNEIDSLKR